VRIKACILVAAILGPSTARTTADDTMSVDVLRAALQTQLDSIQSVTAIFSESFRVAPGQSLAGEPPLAASRYEWAAAPPRGFLRVHALGDSSGYSMFFDGQKGYVVKDPLGAGQYPNVSIQADAPGGMLARDVPTDPIGGRVPLTNQPLAKLMSDPSCRLVGLADVDGVSCWKIYLESIDERAQAPISVTAFFDPMHGNLPRQIDVLQLSNDAPKGWFMTWAVTEFAPVPGRATALKWFPRVAEFRQDIGVFTMTVTEFAINDPLPESRFTPDLSAGAVVFDRSGGSGIRRYVVASSAMVDERITAITPADVREQFPDKESFAQPSALPSHGGGWSIAVFLVSLGMLVAGITLWIRAKR